MRGQVIEALRSPGIGPTPFVQLAKAMGAGNCRAGALAYAEANGADARVLRVIKENVPAGSLSDSDWAGDLATLAAGFISSIRPRSLFYYASGLVDPVAWRAGVNAMSLIPASDHAEGGFVAMGDGAGLVDQSEPVPHCVTSLVVGTRELFTATTAAAFARLRRELQEGAIKSVDARFWSILAAGATVIPTNDAAMANIRHALAIVNTTGAGAQTCFFAAAPDSANSIATMVGLTGSRVFPDATPFGGSILNIPVIVTDAIPAGALALIQAGSLALNSGVVDIDYGSSASIQFKTDPTQNSTTPTATQLVSLFQTGARSIRLSHRFIAEKVRSNACVLLSHVATNWGDAAS